jgi:hypothetical protein
MLVWISEEEHPPYMPKFVRGIATYASLVPVCLGNAKAADITAYLGNFDPMRCPVRYDTFVLRVLLVSH